MSIPLVYLRDIQKRPRIFSVWERRRHSESVHWAIECFAEALGVFFYVFFGLGSQVVWVFQGVEKQAGLSSVFQIGMAYAFGIIFAITVCASTSGGHFNPAITVTMVLLRGFPQGKALSYIIAQIFGGYIACLVVYCQWKSFLDVAEASLVQSGAFSTTMFTPSGVAGAFANYMAEGQVTGRAFLNEFVNCTMIGLVIWAALDPANILMPPALIPFIVGFAYAAAIWGFAVPSVSLNSARDLGGRFAAMTIWGLNAKGNSYSAISALLSIPATVFAAILYEIFLVDSDRVIDTAHLDYIRVHANHARTGNAACGEKHDRRGEITTESMDKTDVSIYDHAPENGRSSHV